MNPKDFGKNFKKLGPPKTKTPPSNICPKENDGLPFCSLSIANNLIEKLPTGPNKFDINSVWEFYRPLNLEENPFHFTRVSENTISDFLKECKIAKLKPLYKKGKETDPKNYRPISSINQSKQIYFTA